MTIKDTGWINVDLDVLADLEEVEGGAGFDDPELATRALFNEYGTEDIPSRPFMRTAFDGHERAYIRQMKRGLGDVIDGRRRPRAVARDLAEAMRDDIVEAIESPPGPPNDPETAEEKESSSPLVDSGEMRAGVVAHVGKLRGGGG